jgi:hypothetical protein
VDVTGQFRNGWGTGIDTRGLVTRVQMASRPYHLVSEKMWEPVHDGLVTYRDVDQAPRWPRRGEDKNSNPREVTVGALIELNLDEVPRLPARPRIVAGDVSADAGGTWVTDECMPIVAHIANDQTATAYLLPERPIVGRNVFATPTGCWVSGPDGTYRITLGSAAEALDDVGVNHRGVVALGESLLTYFGTGAWAINSPGSEPIPVKMPQGHAVATAVDGDSFIVVFRDPIKNPDELHPLRISLDGQVTFGPVLPTIDDESDVRWFFAGTPPHLFCGRTVIPIQTDLSAGTPNRLPRAPLSGGSVGLHAWIVTHPPNRKDPDRVAGWPLQEPTSFVDSHRQYWLLTIVDPTTLQPLRSYPIPTPRPAVTEGADGTIWITGSGLRRLPAEPMRWPESLAVDPMITRTITPVPHPNQRASRVPFRQ